MRFVPQECGENAGHQYSHTTQQPAFPGPQLKLPRASRGQEVDRDRGNHANGIQPRELRDVWKHQQERRGDEHGQKQSVAGHAMAIEAGQDGGRLAVTGHHVLDCHQVGDRRVDRRQQERTEHERRQEAECGSDVGRRQNVHHVVGSQSVPFWIDQLGVWQRVHGRPEENVQRHHLDEDRYDRPARSHPHRRHHDARHVGDGLDAGERQNDFGEADPGVTPGGDAIPFAHRQLDPRMVQARDGTDRDDEREHDRRHGDDQGRPAHAPWAEPVDETDHPDGSQGTQQLNPHAKNLAADTQVTEGIETGERGGDGVVGAERQSSHNGQNAAGRASRRIDAAAIGILAADDQVATTDQEQQDVDEYDVEQRRMAGEIKRQPQHVEPARAKVTKEHRAGVIPMKLPRPVLTDSSHA